MRAATALLTVFLFSLPALAGDPSAALADLDAARIEPDKAVRVEGLRLNALMGEVQIVDAVLVPVSAVAGRVVELVLLGDAVARLPAPDEVEAGQLELFTGSRNLEEPITEAVLVMCMDAAVDAIMARPGIEIDAAQKQRAFELYEAWKDSTERRTLGVRAAIARDALGDPGASTFFAARFQGDDLGTFFYSFDPDADEQVTLGQFVRLELTKKEERRSRRAIHREQRRGRLIGLQFEDLGSWDTWVSSSLRADDGTIRPGKAPFEPQHYQIRAEIGKKGERIDGTATIDLLAVLDGRSAVPLTIDPRLEARAVRREGGDLPFIQEGGAITVFLTEPVSMGTDLRLEIDYEGVALTKLAKRLYSLNATLNWYPRAGVVDRASYDLDITAPEKLDLLATGVVVSNEVGSDGRRRLRTRQEIPSIGASFEIGDYERLERQVGHVAVTLACARDTEDIPEDKKELVLDTLADGLEYFEEIYGPYPLDHLTVVSAPREYSQGLLGFISLSSFIMQPYSILHFIYGVEDHRNTIIHELAHQWWGNQIGWKSYRDQWLSEAMADHATLMWIRHRVPANRKPIVGPISGWQEMINFTSNDGRPFEALGPIVLGVRLESSLAEGAYATIVYEKGAVLLNMLAQSVGEENFLKGLRQIYTRTAGRSMSTEDFLKAMEVLFASDFSWFRDQYVYGTGLPEVYYQWEARENEAGNGWVISGKTRQQTPWRYDWALTRESGRLDIKRETVGQIDVEESQLIAPFRIGIHNPEVAEGESSEEETAEKESHRRKKRRKKKEKKPEAEPVERPNQWIVGRMGLKGTEYTFEVPLQHKPLRMLLDPQGEVFGRFFSETDAPKRITFYRGLDATAAGDLSEAERLFREALELPVGPEARSDRLRKRQERESKILDARIRRELAWIMIDVNRLDEARAQLEAAQETYEDISTVRAESRLELLTGDARSAYRRLRRAVLKRRQDTGTPAWMLLAIAARESDETKALERAMAALERRGIDTSLLD